MAASPPLDPQGALDAFSALCPAPALRFDGRGRILHANAAFAALQLPPFDELAHASPALRRMLACTSDGPLETLREADAPVLIEGTLTDARGHQRSFTARVAALAGQDVFMAVLEDRSSKRDRDLTRQVELDSVQVGIVTVGPEGIEWMNRSARRMFGVSLSDCIGQPMSIVATPEPEHPLRQTHRLDDLREGESESFECRLQALDGREFWVAGNALVTGQGSERRLTYALLDIDRRRQAEAQTEAARASLARIIEAAPLAISLHDARSCRIERINQAAADLAGQPMHMLLGAQPEALFGPEHGARITEDMELAMRAEIGAVIEREYRSGEGSAQRIWDMRLLHLSGGNDAGDTGDAGQVLLVATDVTAQRAAQAERLQHAIAQRELLVREVHHRIKNNLQGVAGLLQQAAVRRPEVADVIREAVGQVSAIAQVYGLQVGGDGPLRIRHVMEAIVGSVRRMSGRSIHTAIVNEQSPDVDSWLLPDGDSIPIALALNELLTNAIKHGAVGEVSCTLFSRLDRVVLEVRNPGSLPPGFDPVQLSPSVSGLSLVKALLPRRGARLSFAQVDGSVLCCVELSPPSVRLAPQSSNNPAAARPRQFSA
ncbi:MAG TPA: PAS domain-containing protein [Burkholderiaceae bacterium]|jgi:PAS domain S-box-containing protein